jgi:hypothetical protein
MECNTQLQHAERSCPFKYTVQLQYDKRKSALSDIFKLVTGVFTVRLLNTVWLTKNEICARQLTTGEYK